jgi:hypothetical protein
MQFLRIEAITLCDIVFQDTSVLESVKQNLLLDFFFCAIKETPLVHAVYDRMLLRCGRRRR